MVPIGWGSSLSISGRCRETGVAFTGWTDPLKKTGQVLSVVLNPYSRNLSPSNRTIQLAGSEHGGIPVKRISLVALSATAAMAQVPATTATAVAAPVAATPVAYNTAAALL